jgi:sucrose phosphorylase
MLATPNDHDSVEKRGMNRAINRHRWDYPDLRDRLDRPDTDQAQVMAGLRARLQLRRRQPAFHPNATQFTINTADDRVFGLWRQSLDRRQSVFALHNVSAQSVSLPSTCLNLIEDEDWIDLLSGDRIDEDDIPLSPYQCRWISNMRY